jgi:hypothetical protein
MVRMLQVQSPPTWLEKILDTLIGHLQDDVIKTKIKLLVLEPFLQYFIELVFPYMILICAVIGIMILLMVSILAILVYKLRVTTPFPE